MAKEEKHKRTILIVILCFLLIIAAALAVFVISNAENSTENTITSEIDENFDPLVASIEEVISHYQAKINNTEDSSKKVEYYDARLKTIIEKDRDREYVSQVLSDIVSIDDIDQTSTSAMQVCGFAKLYGEEALYDKYYKIYEDRQSIENQNNEETKG